MSVSARASGRGFELALELDRDDLLPGRLVDGVLAISSRDGGALRGARVTLQGTETWRYDTTTTDAHGRTRTETKTVHEDVPRVPVALLGATTLAPGERREIPFQLPVPALGPATFEGTELRVDWDVTANLDVGGFDPAVVLPVRVLQPTSLLRAGVVDVGPFALFDAADVAADGLAGTLRLDPVPLCVGAPFRGELLVAEGPAREVQEVRLELRVTARSTVSGGREETIPLWSGRLAEAGDFGGRGWTYPFEGAIVGPSLPTIRTAHGRADATFHVIVALAWAPDPHLVRDVAICSTTEL
jgi:hypothetical protein